MPNILKKLLIYIFLTIIGFSYWIKISFGDVSVDQLLFHVYHTKITDLAGLNAYFRNSFLIFTFICPLIVLSLLLFASSKFQLLQRGMLNNFSILVVSIFSLVMFGHNISATSYLKALLGSDYFVVHYLPPTQIKIQEQQKKNLIYIYVESMESTYRNSDLMGQNLLTILDTLKIKYPTVEFDDYTQIKGAHWTIAGMVGSQCGIPLKQISVTKDSNEQNQLFGSYLANAKCLTDILKEHGYTNHFIQGTFAGFAGTNEFYLNHSTDKVYGDVEWPSVYPQFAPLFRNKKTHVPGAWTSNDDQLFVYARLQVDELMAKKQPFNLMIATYDTHPTSGFLSPTCAKKGVKPTEFEKILECTQEQVVSYIDYLATKGYLKNTQVVIQGDHLTMQNPLYDQLLKAKKRTVYNLLIGDFAGLQKNNDHVNHFDMLPTTLDFIGLKVDGGKAGLGYSAFNSISTKDADKRNVEMQENVLNYSKAYNSLWETKQF